MIAVHGNPPTISNHAIFKVSKKACRIIASTCALTNVMHEPTIFPRVAGDNSNALDLLLKHHNYSMTIERSDHAVTSLFLRSNESNQRLPVQLDITTLRIEIACRHSYRLFHHDLPGSNRYHSTRYRDNCFEFHPSKCQLQPEVLFSRDYRLEKIRTYRIYLKKTHL